MVLEQINPRKQTETKVDAMQNQPYWDKAKREWVLEYKINDKDIGEYVQRVRFETLASANAYLQTLNKRKIK